MIKVCVEPVPKLGLAMRRVAKALASTCPPWAAIVERPEQADVQLLHAVGLDVRRHLRAPHYAVMMHCLDYQQDPHGGGSNRRIEVAKGVEPWAAVWAKSLVTWSYYPEIGKRFGWGGGFGAPKDHHDTPPINHLAPLGVDTDVFTTEGNTARDIGILTTGYVSGPHAEAIEEAALAAAKHGLRTVHLGPSQVGGMTATVPGWSSVTGISDSELAALYRRCQWVSGLRHGEGFELPVLEGLACGARPICFDLPCYRAWFSDMVEYVPESSGDELVESLAACMQSPRPVTQAERESVCRLFSWHRHASEFWRALEVACKQTSELAHRVTAPEQPAPHVSVESARRRLLWVGDSPTTPWTGFGRATTKILPALDESFEVHVLGTTHDGTPYDRSVIPWDVHPNPARLAGLVTELRPSVVVLQHDPWQVETWIEACGNVPVVATMPIDGRNCRCSGLNTLRLAIWWTQFAEQEARRCGYSGPSTVIPLGVDLDIYAPIDKATARERLGFPRELTGAFWVGTVARNQPRKRLDLTVRHFSEWVKSRDVSDAYLYLQTAATMEHAYDVSSLMEYEGLANRLMLIEPKLRHSRPERDMAVIYAALDVYFTTTQGEGWGLPAMEAMACGTPVVAPDWAALGDWARPAAHLVECSDTSCTINPIGALSGQRVGVIGGVPSVDGDVAALDRLYRDRSYRGELRDRGLTLVSKPEYRWEAIGAAFRKAIEGALDRGPIRVLDDTSPVTREEVTA